MTRKPIATPTSGAERLITVSITSVMRPQTSVPSQQIRLTEPPMLMRLHIIIWGIAISSRRTTKRHIQLSGSMSTSKKTHRRYRWPMPITESATACSITVSSRRPKSNTHAPRHCSLRAEIMRFIRKDSFWDCRKITKERST